MSKLPNELAKIITFEWCLNEGPLCSDWTDLCLDLNAGSEPPVTPADGHVTPRRARPRVLVCEQADSGVVCVWLYCRTEASSNWTWTQP